MAKTKKIFPSIFSSKRVLLSLLLAVLVLGVFFSLPQNCFAYQYTPEQIAELKKGGGMFSWNPNGAWWTDKALETVQKQYSWDDLQKLSKSLYATDIIKAAEEGKTVEQALQSNFQTKMEGTADLAYGVSHTDDSLGLKMILAPIIGVLFLIAYFLKEFVAISASILDLVLRPELYTTINNDLVRQGWMIVRDVCNLFFLLALLFIAICTILKIEKYHAKKTLLMLIIMALLINFSKPIAFFIFDGSQLLMNFFLSQMANGNQAPTTMFAKATEIASITYASIDQYNFFTQSGGQHAGIALQYLFSIIFLFMLLVAFLVIALMLLIRIVAVMMLIIVSPMAFFAAIIPDFSNLGSKWWKTLFEYSYYGPAAAFFLLLATTLSQHLPKVTGVLQGVPGNTSSTIGPLLINIVNYLTTIIFLYASIIMAKQFGGGVGAAVVGNANRFMKWAGGMTKGGGMWGGVARVTGAADVYKGIKQGIGKQPYWRVLTKEGREAKRKETREKWERRFAPFNIADAKKKSEERKNDAEADIERDALNGDIAAIIQASSRGGGLAQRVFANNRVRELMRQYADLRNTAYKNLRDNNQSHIQAELEAERRIPATMAPIAAANEMNDINRDLFEGASTRSLFEERDLGAALATEQGGARGNFLSNNVQARLTRMQDNDARRILTDGKVRGQISQQILARIARNGPGDRAEANAIIAFARTGRDPFAPPPAGGGFAVI